VRVLLVLELRATHPLPGGGRNGALAAVEGEVVLGEVSWQPSTPGATCRSSDRGATAACQLASRAGLLKAGPSIRKTRGALWKPGRSREMDTCLQFGYRD